MDLTSGLQAALQESERLARELESKGELEDASREYSRCAHLITEIAKQSRTANVRQQRLARAQRYRDRADALLQGGTVRRPPRAPAPEAAEGDDLTERVRSLVRKADVNWDGIAGLRDVKSQIRSLFAIALAQKPTNVVVEKRPNILLYGPPGTGKTLIAAAASGSLAATFYSIKAGDLLSKFFGESSQLVGKLYEEAVRTEPSVVFIDEIESLTPDRDSPGGVSGPEGRILSQFLAELDGLDSKSADEIVITIAATNKPWDLDDAVLSRFARSIYVPLPDPDARREIFRLSLEGQGYKCEGSLDELAASSEGRSGREISAACREAIRSMIVRANPGLEDRVDAGAEAIRSYQLQFQPITQSEVMDAFSRIRSLSGTEALARYERWAESE